MDRTVHALITMTTTRPHESERAPPLRPHVPVYVVVSPSSSYIITIETFEGSPKASKHHEKISQSLGASDKKETRWHPTCGLHDTRDLSIPSRGEGWAPGMGQFGNLAIQLRKIWSGWA